MDFITSFFSDSSYFEIISIALVLLVLIHLVQLFYCPVTDRFNKKIKNKERLVCWHQLKSREEPDQIISLGHLKKSEELLLDLAYESGMQAKIVMPEEDKQAEPVNKPQRTVDEGANALMRKLSADGHKVVDLSMARAIKKDFLYQEKDED